MQLISNFSLPDSYENAAIASQCVPVRNDVVI